MDQELIARFLTSDSDEAADLKANHELLAGFVSLVQDVDALPDNSKRFYEESRSLYQATIIKRSIGDLENLLSKFFGEPVKSAGKTLPRKYRKSSVIKYLGGIEKDQSLFIVELKTGQFYGALWPWRRNKSKIEVHLGYCSDWMTDDDYQQLENLVHQCVSDRAFEQMDAGIGGQIHGISLPSFLQMSEMEKSSFTLRVTSRNRIGFLHMSEGSLKSARFDDLAGRDAAYRIISWDDVTIDIEPSDSSEKDEIKQPLMHVLMESLKLKDEAGITEDAPPPMPKGRPRTKRRPAADKPAKRLVRLERAPEPRAPQKRLHLLTLVAIGVGCFAIIAAATVGYFNYMENRRTSDGYRELMDQVENVDVLERKVELLQAYIKKRINSPYKATIQSMLTDLHNKIEDRDYDQTTLAVSALPLDEHYEEQAIELFSQFLDKYPNSQKTEQINKSVGEIKNLLDQYYYEELKRAARLDFSKRLETYRRYLEKFPAGSYKQDVDILISEMGQKYLSYLQNEAGQCEQKQQWDLCISHCDSFIQAYAGSELAQKAGNLKKQLEDQRDYVQLRKTASESGSDFQKAYQSYQTYLAGHPDSIQRGEIEKEMTRLSRQIKEQQNWLAMRAYATDSRHGLFERIQKLDRYLKKNISGAFAGEAQSLLAQLEEERRNSLRKSQLQAKIQSEQARMQRLQEEQAQRQARVQRLQAEMESRLKASARYQSNGDGTFKDAATGLTWSTLDSYQELGGCVTYEAGQRYLKSLHHGGISAWRLPTANELATLYKQAPYFPDSGAQWYWSIETAVKGYHSVAEVVTAEHESVFKRSQRELTECGNVRAVLATQ